MSEYTNYSTIELKESYTKLVKGLSERPTLIRVLELLNSEPNLDEKTIIDVYKNFIIQDEEYIKQLVVLKEKIRQELERHKNEIILEDIFTSFDKTNVVKEHGNKYTYQEMDSIRYSITRLFVYYFGIRTTNHKLDHCDYLQTMAFVKSNKANLSIITTNWDTIFELYIKNDNIKVDLSLNDPYYKINNRKVATRKNQNSIKFIKVHGSINWCKCLNCGLISIVENKPFDEFLFNDKVVEKCSSCKKEAKDSSVQLQPEIITPTMIKSISSQLYNNLWREASIELSKASKIIFVGYSLPTADFEFRYLLKRNINPTAKIDVVLSENDPKGIAKKGKHIKNLLPYKRYEELFSQNEVKFFYKGFGKYFEEENKKSHVSTP